MRAAPQDLFKMHASFHGRAASATRRGAALAAAITFLLYVTPLLFGQFYFGIDLTNSDMGTICEIKNLLAQGLGLWLSPHMGEGGALLARPSAQLFYPLRWMLIGLPVPWAQSLTPIVHLAIAAAATTWLARTHGLRPGLSCGLGLAFALTGPVANLIYHSYYIVGAAWIPLIWAATRHALRQRAGRAPAAIVALGFALCLLGGEPQAALLAGVIMLMEMAAQGYQKKQIAWETVLRLLIAPVVGLLLSLPLWLPFWGEAQLGTRGASLKLDEILSWSFDAVRWPTAFLHGPLVSQHWWVQAIDANVGVVASEWNKTPYLGGLLLIFVVVSFTQRGHSVAKGILILSVLCALGDSTPFYPLLVRAIPVLQIFRYPQKYLPVVALAALLLAGSVLRHLHRSPPLRRRVSLAALAWTVGLATMVGLIVALRGPLDAAVEGLLVYPKFRNLNGFASSLAWALTLAAAPSALLLIWLQGRRSLSWLPLFVLIADLGYGVLQSSMVGPSLHDLNSPLAQIHSEPPPIFCTRSSLRLYSFKKTLDNDSGWMANSFNRIYAIRETQSCDQLTASVPYSPLISRVAKNLGLAGQDLPPTVARSLGCTHVISPFPINSPDVELEPFPELPPAARDFMRHGPPVYRILDPLPEAAVIASPVLRTNEPQVLREMYEARNATAALSIIDDPLGRWPPSRPLPQATSATIAHIDLDRSDAIEAQLRGQGGAVLFVRRAYLVGWRAWQGERELPIVRVAGHHLAVVVNDVSAGELRLRYRPPHLTLALWGAALGLLTLLGLALWQPRRSKKMRSPLTAPS